MSEPLSLYFSKKIEDGDIFFFSTDCPIGIKDHMHICVKHKDRYLFFSTCSSQIDTAMRIAKIRGYDANTFPVFPKDMENRFHKPQTYVNCNRVFEVSEEEFAELYEGGMVRLLDGKIGADGLRLIAKGIKLSPDVEGRIKKMFAEKRL